MIGGLQLFKADGSLFFDYTKNVCMCIATIETKDVSGIIYDDRIKADRAFMFTHVDDPKSVFKGVITTYPVSVYCDVFDGRVEWRRIDLTVVYTASNPATIKSIVDELNISFKAYLMVF